MQVSGIDNRINCKNIGFGTKKLTTLVKDKETKPTEIIKFDLRSHSERMKKISKQSRIHLAKAIKAAKEILIK